MLFDSPAVLQQLGAALYVVHCLSCTALKQVAVQLLLFFVDCFLLSVLSLQAAAVAACTGCCLALSALCMPHVTSASTRCCWLFSGGLAQALPDSQLRHSVVVRASASQHGVQADSGESPAGQLAHAACLTALAVGAPHCFLGPFHEKGVVCVLHVAAAEPPALFFGCFP